MKDCCRTEVLGILLPMIRKRKLPNNLQDIQFDCLTCGYGHCMCEHNRLIEETILSLN